MGERLTAILMWSGQLRAAAHASPDRPLAELNDEADLLGHRDEGAGRNQALLGMAPADQGLDPADLVGPEIDDGLVVQLELAGGQRLAQIVLHGAPHLHLRVHLRPEEAVGAAPVALGAVERQVGVADQLVGALPVRRADGDADAGADHHLRAVEIVGRAHRLDDAQRQHGGIRRLRDGDLQDRELVSAHARDRVRLPHQGAQALRHHLQQLVAGGMAERVVHGLEVVEIEQVDRHHLAAPARAPARARAARSAARGWADRSARRAAPCARSWPPSGAAR